VLDRYLAHRNTTEKLVFSDSTRDAQLKAKETKKWLDEWQVLWEKLGSRKE
jgi:hypothetical protein